MDVVYSPLLEAYKSAGQIHFGQVGTCPEVPDRTRQIVAALLAAGLGIVIEPGRFDLEHARAVHEGGYLDFLRTANQRPMRDPESDGQPAKILFPAAWPYSNLWPVRHASVMADAGVYCFDTYAPLTAEVFQAAWLSAQCALTAADRVQAGEPVALAACRPPGHHAMRTKCGGFCYLNNAAIAAQFLAGSGRVAILDIDYHHGNGTQEIFYDTDQVLYGSLHADPAEAYPYFSGYSEERGIGKGLGYNLNIPLPTGTDDAQYGAALDFALNTIQQFAPRFLVVSLGFDICIADPLTTFKVGPEYFSVIASKISNLEIPTVILTEGGYDLAQVGQLAVHFVRGWQSKKARIARSS